MKSPPWQNAKSIKTYYATKSNMAEIPEMAQPLIRHCFLLYCRLRKTRTRNCMMNGQFSVHLEGAKRKLPRWRSVWWVAGAVKIGGGLMSTYFLASPSIEKYNKYHETYMPFLLMDYTLW